MNSGGIGVFRWVAWWGVAALPLVSAQASGASVLLQIVNDVSSVWTTDGSKIGVELQIENSGSEAAEDVRVISVGVKGGALADGTRLPVALGTIRPQASGLLDFIIDNGIPVTGASYLIRVYGTYRGGAGLHQFSLHHAVSLMAAPHSIVPRHGVSGKDQLTSPASPTTNSPGWGPNATTPMMIPVGPPRQLSLPGPTMNR